MPPDECFRVSARSMPCAGNWPPSNNPLACCANRQRTPRKLGLSSLRKRKSTCAIVPLGTAPGCAGRVGPSELTFPKSRHDGRDRSFREMVLRAYKSRCALCQLDVRVEGLPVGIEAAHIKWHSARGPPRVENGMALCVLHHKFFDSGLFTVLSDLTVWVGGLAVGETAYRNR